jgi:hypothetical protein
MKESFQERELSYFIGWASPIQQHVCKSLPEKGFCSSATGFFQD